MKESSTASRDTAWAMSEENVEIVRKVIDAISAREVPEDLIAPDIHLQNVRTAVSDNLYVGHDGVRKWQQDFFGVMDEDARLEVEDVIAFGEDCVVVTLRLAGHGAKSGAPLELRWPQVIWLRQGRITRTTGYGSRREALEAAGLRE
jgi:ketosteroid isomerase-like protein